MEAALASLPVPAKLQRVWGLTLYHIEDLPYHDIPEDLPMSFAPFGRAVRGNLRAADATAVAAAQRGEQGVSIRQELEAPKRLPQVPAGLQRLSVEDIEGSWPPPAASHNATYVTLPTAGHHVRPPPAGVCVPSQSHDPQLCSLGLVACTCVCPTMESHAWNISRCPIGAGCQCVF